jgi:hypothetical protein
MGFTWTEIKKWAKTHNLEPKKIKEGGYKLDDKDYSDINELVIALWNIVSNNKWVEHQSQYKKNI